MKITLNRRRSIEGHIRHDDYFGTLATVFDLLRQDMGKSGKQRAHKELLERLRDDLLHLQNNYEIRPKKKFHNPISL